MLPRIVLKFTTDGVFWFYETKTMTIQQEYSEKLRWSFHCEAIRKVCSIGTYWYILNYTSVESGQTVTIILKDDTSDLVDNKKKKDTFFNLGF
jgi:hypothetical protein